MRLRLWVAQINVVVSMVHLELLYKPAAISRGKPDGRLVVVSNRVPLPSSSVAPAAGGLAVALQAALKPRGGLWFGWSGKTSEESGPAAQCRTVGSLTYAVSYRAAISNNITMASPTGRFGRFVIIASTSPNCRSAPPPPISG